MNPIQKLKQDYPWIQTPLIVGAPMRLIALADMAVEISKAGGIGFIGAGTDVTDLPTHLQHAQQLLQQTSLPNSPTLPIGIGFINWGAPFSASIPIIAEYQPAAVWFFAPSSLSSLVGWAEASRRASPATKIWVQIGSVKDAVQVARYVRPDVLVVQGTDAGGHGLVRGASLITLLPEVCDALQEQCTASPPRPNIDTLSDKRGSETEEVIKPIILAAGGISEARTAASALTLGASGLILGTRLLATPQARIPPGYQSTILRTTDGGQSTVRTKIYDTLRGTNWAKTHNGRAVINQSYVDAVERGMSEEQNKKLYQEAMETKGDEVWGEQGRMTTYAGSGVGLIREVKEVGHVVGEVREGVERILHGAREEAKL